MEKIMVNGQYHDPLDLNSNSSLAIEASPSQNTSFFSPSLSHIEHSVSKFDTLAGVAIKYGVEVADIKKLNGLVTDHQMFARKTLHIPSPGRHPPSSIVPDATDNHWPSSSEQTPPMRRKSDFFESFKLGSSPMQNVSPAMSTLQGYYGLEPAEEKSHSEGLEMAVYPKGGALYPWNGSFNDSVAPSNVPFSHHRKCKSVAYDLYAKSIQANNEEANENDSGKLIESLSRWRKSEVNLTSKAPEMLLKEEVSSSGGFSALGSKASKGLALRPAARTVSGGDNVGGFPTALGDSVGAKISSGVRKSSSTPSLQDAENSTSSSSSWLMPNWSLKPDLQALSTSSIPKPIFDGLPKPKTGRKSKAALD